MEELKKYEDYYKPLWEEFISKIKGVNVENCPEPHLPVYGACYNSWKYKIAFVGVDTAGCYKLSEYNCKNGYSRIVQDWKEEEFDELNYCGWAWKWNFWRFIFQFLAKFYDVNLQDLKSHESEEAQNILKSFLWCNALSVERFGVTAKGKKVPFENWEKVKDASSVFDRAEHILNIYQPKVVVLLNWTNVPDGWLPDDIGEPVKYDPIPLWYYYVKKSDTHLYWTKHPRSLTKIGFNVIIHKILQSIRDKKVFQSFPGQTRFELIEKFMIQMKETATEIGMKFSIEKTDENGRQFTDGIDFQFAAEDLYNPLVGFNFYPQYWTEYRIGFSNGLNDFYYGICRQLWNKGKPMSDIQKLTPGLSYLNDEPNDMWPRGKFFEYRNWDTDIDIWNEIRDGSIKTKIKEIIIGICTRVPDIQL